MSAPKSGRAAGASRQESVREVMDGLRRIVRGLRLSARAAEHEAGISGAQHFVLQSLASMSASSLNELADRTFTDQSSVSVVVTRLVKQKLVTRKPSSADARRVELEVTAAGKRLLARCPEPTQVRLLGGLGALSPTDLSALRKGIAALTRQMAIDDSPAKLMFSEKEPKGRVRSRKKG